MCVRVFVTRLQIVLDLVRDFGVSANAAAIGALSAEYGCVAVGVCICAMSMYSFRTIHADGIITSRTV